MGSDEQLQKKWFYWIQLRFLWKPNKLSFKFPRIHTLHVLTNMSPRHEKYKILAVCPVNTQTQRLRFVLNGMAKGLHVECED